MPRQDACARPQVEHLLSLDAQPQRQDFSVEFFGINIAVSGVVRRRESPVKRLAVVDVVIRNHMLSPVSV